MENGKGLPKGEQNDETCPDVYRDKFSNSKMVINSLENSLIPVNRISVKYILQKGLYL